MSQQEDPRIFDAKRLSLKDTLDKLKITRLRDYSGEMVGPCPCCGGHHKRDSDRFAISKDNLVYNCRQCGISGNDQIALARDVLGVGFVDALEALCGDKPAELTPSEKIRRERLQAKQKQRDDDIALQKRLRSRREASRIWKASTPGRMYPELREYLNKRGITETLLPEIPQAMRLAYGLPYVKYIDGRNQTLHQGIAMVCAIQSADGKGVGVHRTWLDLNQSNGKAIIIHEGEELDAKMCRGSQKGCAIRLHTPDLAVEPDKMPFALVVGEGVETTLTAMVAAPIVVAGHELTLENTAFWSAINLGNMSGRMKKVRGVKWSGEPELSDDAAFVPPRWCKLLVFLKDGDSNAKMTQAKCESGIKRAMKLRPGLQGCIVAAGDGRDHNDIIKGGSEQ